MLTTLVLMSALLSQPPAPSPSEIHQPQQHQATYKPAVGQHDNATANNVPPGSNLLFSPKISIVTGDTAGKGKEKSPANWWIIILTAGLVIVGFFGWLTNRRQADIMAGTLAQMKIDSANRVHETAEQFSHAKEQLKLAQDEFFASHRPEVIIHATEYIAMPAGDGTPNEYIGIILLCFNKGRSTANRVEVHADFLFTDELGFDVQRPLRRTYENVASGQKMRIELASDVKISALGESRARLARGEPAPPLRCVGWLAYFDGSNARRETGFCYVLDLGMMQWVSAQDPEREYAF